MSADARALDRPVGINLIGFATPNFSLGNITRQIGAALEARGVPFKVYDVAQDQVLQGSDDALRDHLVADPRDLPYGINLFCLSLWGLSDLISKRSDDAFAWSERLNVALTFWELTVLPAPWREALAGFDAILCCSWFLRETMAAQVPDAVALHAPFPLRLPPVTPAERAAFAIPPDAFTFYFSFDPFATLERKNPLAAIAAFERAFGTDRRAHLLIRMNIPTDRADSVGPAVRELISRCEAMPNATVSMQSQSYAGALALIAACDAFVSLHRSEGLGLGPMEAMLLGKPVIASAWSGNMSYMNADAACLVPCGLVPARGLESVIFDPRFVGAQAFWAEPSVDAAAFWMRRLADDASFAGAMGARARASIEEYTAQAARCRFVDELASLEVLKRGGAFVRPPLADIRRRIVAAHRERAERNAPVTAFLTRNVPGFWRARDLVARLTGRRPASAE